MLCRCFRYDYPSQISSKLWLLACCPLKAKVLIFRHQQMVWAQVTGSAHLLLSAWSFHFVFSLEEFFLPFFFLKQLSYAFKKYFVSFHLTFLTILHWKWFSGYLAIHIARNRCLCHCGFKISLITELYHLHNKYSIKCA